MDANSEELVYAQTQMIGSMNIDKLAEHIASHNSKYNRSDIKGVIESVIDCMIEQMKNGYTVQLGEFGTFYLSVSSTGITVDQLEKSGYNAEYINRVRASWRRGTAFQGLRNEVSLQMVPTRAKQTAGLDSMISDIVSGTTADKDTEPGTESGGGSGGGAD